MASASACLIRILTRRVCRRLILLLLLARKAVLGCACWHIIPSNKEVHLWAIRLSYLCRSCTSISIEHYRQMSSIMLKGAVGDHHLKQRDHFWQVGLLGERIQQETQRTLCLLPHHPTFERESAWEKNDSISVLLFRTHVILLNSSVGLTYVLCPLIFTLLLFAPMVFTLSLRCT